MSDSSKMGAGEMTDIHLDLPGNPMPRVMELYVAGIIMGLREQAERYSEIGTLDWWIDLTKKCLMVFPFNEAYSIAKTIGCELGIDERTADKCIQNAKPYTLQEIVICSSSPLSESWEMLASRDENISNQEVAEISELLKADNIIGALSVYKCLFVAPLSGRNYLNPDSPKDWVYPFIRLIRLHGINLQKNTMNRNNFLLTEDRLASALVKSFIFISVEDFIRRMFPEKVEVEQYIPQISETAFRIVSCFDNREVLGDYFPLIIEMLVELVVNNKGKNNLNELLSFDMNTIAAHIKVLESLPIDCQLPQRLKIAGWQNTPVTIDLKIGNVDELLGALITAANYHFESVLFEREVQDLPQLEILPGMKLYILPASKLSLLPDANLKRVYAPVGQLHTLIFNRDWDMRYTPESSAEYLGKLMLGENTPIDGEKQERLLVVMAAGGVVIGGNVVSIASEQGIILNDLASSLAANYELLDQQGNQAKTLKRNIDMIVKKIEQDETNNIHLEINELFADRKIGQSILNRIFTNLEEIVGSRSLISLRNISTDEEKALVYGLEKLKTSFVGMALKEDWKMTDICKEAFRLITLVLNKAATAYAYEFLSRKGVDTQTAKSIQWTASSSNGALRKGWRDRNRMERIFRLFTGRKTKIGATAVRYIGQYTNPGESATVSEFAANSEVLWEGPIVDNEGFNADGVLRNAPPSNWPVIIGMPLAPFDRIVGDLRLYMAIFRQKYLQILFPDKEIKSELPADPNSGLYLES